MSAQTHVLIVEDDAEIRMLTARFLRANDCRVSLARDGREMERLMADARVDIVVLDIMLPGEDGLSLCKRLRARSKVPIVMVSARGEEVDRVVGLEIGADDYLAKPFGPRELLARIRAVLRRSGEADHGLVEKPRFHVFDGWRLDAVRRTLDSPSGARVTLTGAEFDLLLVLCERPGRVLSRDQLLDLTQGRAPGPYERSIDILVSRLRRKLGAETEAGDLIRTIRAGGYMFVPEVVSS